ncbi:MAG: FAD-binding protein [Saprospiraceae bacterium]|nr:FAD-binding protein [Saprospiraceae bacterium]
MNSTLETLSIKPDLQEVLKLSGDITIYSDPEALAKYGHDETEDFVFLPDAVIIPHTVEALSKVMQYANEHNIYVTVRGGGSGLAGGALPVMAGLLISMEKFNQILLIDEKNLQVTVEPGVITEVLQNKVKEFGLFYPPDPSSRGICFIGGNVATNAGGPKAVKYGVVKDYVLNLEVVLPNGEIIWTGANTLKNSTGYNLTQLMVGSEGTLGIITKIVLKLLPAPPFNLLLLVPFNSAENACAAVSAIFRAGVIPSALEFMEREAIDWAVAYLKDVQLEIGPDVQAHLLIEVDGNHMDQLFSDCEKITEVVEGFGCGEILFADNDAQKTELWRLRRNVAHAVKLNSIYKEEDTVVPRAELPTLLRAVKEIGAKYGFRSVCYGHAGDGNLHVNIVKQELSEEMWNNVIRDGITEIFQVVKSLNGTLSGEHGIGYVQKNYMPIMFNQVELNLMKGIKAVFDPKGILNPGKIFPD